MCTVLYNVYSSNMCVAVFVFFVPHIYNSTDNTGEMLYQMTLLQSFLSISFKYLYLEDFDPDRSCSNNTIMRQVFLAMSCPVHLMLKPWSNGP